MTSLPITMVMNSTMMMMMLLMLWMYRNQLANQFVMKVKSPGYVKRRHLAGLIAREILYTVCPRSSDPFYILTYYIELDTTSWTDGIRKGQPADTRPIKIMNIMIGPLLYCECVTYIFSSFSLLGAYKYIKMTII